MKEFAFEASVGLSKVVYISQCLIELCFIYLCKPSKLIFVSRETHSVRLIKECNSLVVIVGVCNVCVEKLIHSFIWTYHSIY